MVQLDAQGVYSELDQLRSEILSLRSKVESLMQTIRPTVHTEHPHIVRIEGVHIQPSKDMRPFGLCAGEFVVPEDFDDPLPEHVLRGFEGR